MDKVAVITGGTSGIGLAAAQELSKNGFQVYTVSRHIPAYASTLRHLQADVTDEAQTAAVIHAVQKKEGHIDLLINCAGFGISGAIEFTATEDAKKQLDVNFFGMVNACKAALPLMRKAGKGRIINISSVAAPIAIPFQAFYSASKAAINAYTCALANEVRPFGISVTAIQPGDICTGFTAAREKSAIGDEEYQGRISRSVSRMEHDEQCGMRPERAGRFIAKIAEKRNVKPLYTIGFSYRLICVLFKLLPIRVSNWIVGKLYAN